MNRTRLDFFGKLTVVTGLLGWAYLPTLKELFQKWTSEPQYSHGFLVPLFAVYLLYQSRDRLVAEPRPWPIVGYLVLSLALACRGLAALLAFLPLDGLSLVLSLTGLVLLVGGKDLLRSTWHGLVFLIFMIPLPYQVERMMGAELQRIATIVSTFALQTIGQPAIAEGNTILLQEIHLGVVEACSGLRMLMTFFALCVGAVMVMDRHWTVKLLVLASAVPIALFTNILRITATGMTEVITQHSAGHHETMKFFHDFYGLMMPPLGLAFLMLELWVLKHLIMEPTPKFQPN